MATSWRFLTSTLNLPRSLIDHTMASLGRVTHGSGDAYMRGLEVPVAEMVAVDN
jgi:hypothetical protein